MIKDFSPRSVGAQNTKARYIVSVAEGDCHPAVIVAQGKNWRGVRMTAKVNSGC